MSVSILTSLTHIVSEFLPPFPDRMMTMNGHGETPMRLLLRSVLVVVEEEKGTRREGGGWKVSPSRIPHDMRHLAPLLSLIEVSSYARPLFEPPAGVCPTRLSSHPAQKSYET